MVHRIDAISQLRADFFVVRRIGPQRRLAAKEVASAGSSGSHTRIEDELAKAAKASSRMGRFSENSEEGIGGPEERGG